MFRLYKSKTKNKTQVLSPIDYNVLFDKEEFKGIPLELLEIGNLSVPSGQIVVCDPLLYPHMAPLTKRVKPGKYPVKIYVAKIPDSGERYAIAKLEFDDPKAEKWVMALRAGEDINELTDKDDYFGFPVDAGLGSFLDYQSAVAYLKFESEFMKANPRSNIYDDLLAKEFKKNAQAPDDPSDPGDWVNFKLPETNLNVAMFHSGFGDGTYPAYWALTKREK
ncbi:MAG: DUF4241 domain-containing protein [Roseivirga sp.]|nr:DUF4241 domain-containing protein [Roseivirga sp.]